MRLAWLYLLAASLVLWTGCLDDPYASSSVDDASGMLDGVDSCNCTIHRRDSPSVQLSCSDNKLGLFIDLGTPGVTYVGNVQFLYQPGSPHGSSTYFGTGRAILTIGEAYDDPRGKPFDLQYRSTFVKSLVMSAQRAYNPIGQNDFVDTPESTLIGARVYCQEARDGL